MSGRVHDIDTIVLPIDGTVFGLDRDAAFAFERHAIHDSFLYLRVLFECLRSAEDRVDQGCLSVVYMSDNRDIADF